MAKKKLLLNPDYTEEDLKEVEDILIPIKDGAKTYNDGTVRYWKNGKFTVKMVLLLRSHMARVSGIKMGLDFSLMANMNGLMKDIGIRAMNFIVPMVPLS